MNVFVIGGCHHNALGVIRSLGEKGIRPYVVIQSDEEKPYIRLSRYISQYWIVASEQEVLAILKNEAVHFHGEKAVLITCADNLSSLVDMNHDELQQWYSLPGTEEQGRVTKLMDKEVMSQLAREVGLLVPASASVNTAQSYIPDILMPWIVKPLVSKNASKCDIAIIHSREEWKEYCLCRQLPVQVQKFVANDNEYQLIGLSLRGGSEVIIPGVSHVIRPSANTNTGFLHYKPLDTSYSEVIRKGKQFLKATGYSGLFSLEFLRDYHGNDYFMEINFRNDGNSICVTAAGVNLPYIWYAFHAGEDYQKEIGQEKINTVFVMPEIEDFRLVSRGKLNIFTWLKDVCRTDRFMEYDEQDKAPFWQLLREFLFRGVRKIFKKIIPLRK